MLDPLEKEGGEDVLTSILEIKAKGSILHLPPMSGWKLPSWSFRFLLICISDCATFTFESCMSWVEPPSDFGVVCFYCCYDSDPVLSMQHFSCLISVFVGSGVFTQEVGFAKKISPFLLLLRDLTLYSGWADRIRKKRREDRVIGVHALCIISYREEDGAASGNESGWWCSEVNATNPNEDAAFAVGHIWLKASHGEHGTVVLSAKTQQVEEPEPTRDEFLGLFLARLEIKDLMAD